MRFFLDENMPLVAIEPLVSIFGNRHEFEHAATLDLIGEDDVALYPRVREAGVDAIISKDGRQLLNEIERRGLFENGLSFVHLRMTNDSGAKGLAMLLASLTAGLALIEERWDPDRPEVFRLRGLQSGFTERISKHEPLWRPEWGDEPGR